MGRHLPMSLIMCLAASCSQEQVDPSGAQSRKATVLSVDNTQRSAASINRTVPDWLLGTWEVEKAEDHRPRAGCPCRLQQQPPSVPRHAVPLRPPSPPCNRDQPLRYDFKQSIIQSDVWGESIRLVRPYPERDDVVEIQTEVRNRQPSRLDYTIYRHDKKIIVDAHIADDPGICFVATAIRTKVSKVNSSQNIWRLPSPVP